MNVSLFAIINLIGASQGLFLTTHFLQKKSGNSWLNKVISILIFCLSANLFNVFYILSDGGLFQEIIQQIVNNLMWFIGPSIYLYTIFKPSQNNKKLFLIHYLPFIVLFFIGLLDQKNQISNYYFIFVTIQIVLYLLISIRNLIRFYDKKKSFYKWVMPVIISFSLLFFLNFLFMVISQNKTYNISKDIILNLNLLSTVPIFILAYKEMNSIENFGWKEERYTSRQLDDEKSKKYLNQIRHLLEQELLYKDTHLTLRVLSDRLQIPAKYISQTINTRLSISFPDFINLYRIEDVKKNLINPDKSHLTILGIAQESGFKSGGRFNTLFKQATGLTPTDYRKKHQNQL